MKDTDKRRVLKQIRALADGNDMSKAKEIASLLQRVRNYRWVGIYSVEGNEIIAIGWSGSEAPSYPRFPVSQGLCGAAVSGQASIIVGDVTKDPRYLTTFGSTHSEIIVPVFGEREAVTGLIDVESEQQNAFSETDRAFLEESAAAIRGLWRER